MDGSGAPPPMQALPAAELRIQGEARQRVPDGRLSYAVRSFATSGAAVASSICVTHPMDVLKVRLQMQMAGQRGPLMGMRRLGAQIVRSEGVGALYLGIMPALTRSVLYGGLRLALYEPFKSFGDSALGSTNVFVKIASGVCSGTFATALTNPVEVLKVRLQMNSKSRTGAMKELQKIVSEEGVKALWKGVGPAMARAGAMTASQLVTYDESKQMLLRKTSLKEGVYLHLIASSIAGAVGSIVTAPADMIKTRLMVQQGSQGTMKYKNAFHCAYQVIHTEGFRGLYKGGFATFARLAPQTVIILVVCEKLRALVGLKAI